MLGIKLDRVMLAILGSIPLHSVAEKTGVQVFKSGP